MVWQPNVMPGYLHETDPTPLAVLAANALIDLSRQQDFSLEVDEVEGFMIHAEQTECTIDGREFAYWLSQQLTQIGSGDQTTLIRYSYAGSPDDYSETLAELSAQLVQQDRKYLGMPLIIDETTINAGPNGYGRCNVYGTRRPALELFNDEPPLAIDQLYDDFFDATLIEVNEGDYDYLPWFFFLNDVFGIAAFGDCEEASARAADYLDRSIARMDEWGVDRPITYRLFLPEQVEGLSESEINRAWEAGEIEPAGLTNAE